MGKLIDTDRLKEIFRRNVAGGNAYFDLIDNAPTVEAIPKSEYEARLKADMIAMLTDLKTAIYIMYTVVEHRTVTITSWKGMQKRICNLIQSKIDKLKENTDDN